MSPELGYTCPACQAPLRAEASALHCANCVVAYPLVDGIPNFCPAQPYYGEIELERMRALISRAQDAGYQQALQEHLGDQFVYIYAADENRAKWMELLPLDRASVVLDAGCGWGTNTIPLSREVRLIVALDATVERARFVQLRAIQTGAPNVVPVAASALALPFAPGQFDVVAFNGVLEWLGASDPTLNPEECQMRALKEAFRVLKPGGRLYVGIENRFSLRYFLGKPDDHSFIRFTSLMPRWLANMYCRLRTGKRYLTYTYSLRGYRELLTRAGFPAVKAYYPWPNYRNPEQIVPLTADSVLDVLRSQRQMARSVPQVAYILLLQAITALTDSGTACHSFCLVAERVIAPLI